MNAMLTSLALAAVLGPQNAVVKQASGVSSLTYSGSSVHRTRGAIRNLRSFAEDGAVALSWDEVSKSGSTPMQALSRDGGKTWPKVGETDVFLRLRHGTFDPARSQPTLPEGLRAGEDCRLVIVQFNTQVLPEYHEAIKNIGGEIYTYMPDSALVCVLDANEREVVRGMPFVRWMGNYEPGYRLDPAVVAQLEAGTRPTDYYMIQVSDWEGLTKNVVAERIRMIGGTAEAPVGGAFMYATLTPFQLGQVAGWDEVFFIDVNGQPGVDMDIVRSVGGTTVLRNLPENYKGQGIRAEVMDSGLRTTHDDFDQPTADFIIRENGSSISHGTSTTGIVFGSGWTNPAGEGQIPSAQGIFAAYTSLAGNGGSTTRLASTQALVNLQGIFQSNSWGSSLTTAYNTKSTEMDQIIFNLDILILNSQSNAGTQNSRPEAWAKNVVSVGGISHFNTASYDDDQWAGASIGPAADGRLKPDICNWYDNIFTTSSSSDTSYTSGFNGTSAATPITAGFFGLWFQLWSDGVFGNTVLAATPFEAKPKYTLAKAWMINQARQYAFSGASATNSRYKQGWGLSRIGGAYDNRDRVFWINETDPLTVLQVKTYRVFVPAGTPEFKATMVYNDLPGTTSSTRHRINDLSLRVTSPNGTVYHGNNGLTAGNYSSSGGSSNIIDTVENVLLANPASGVWTVQVSASEINMDARPETVGVNDADFALVVSGVDMTATVTDSQVTYGSVVQGATADLKTSNNRPLELTHPVEYNDVMFYEIGQVVSGTAPFAAPATLKFVIESRSSEINTTQRVELFNYVSNSYEEVDWNPLPGTDSAREIVISTDASRFVRTSDRQVKARLTWFHEILNDVEWRVNIDQQRWFFTP